MVHSPPASIQAAHDLFGSSKQVNCQKQVFLLMTQCRVRTQPSSSAASQDQPVHTGNSGCTKQEPSLLTSTFLDRPEAEAPGSVRALQACFTSPVLKASHAPAGTAASSTTTSRKTPLGV